MSDQRFIRVLGGAAIVLMGSLLASCGGASSSGGGSSSDTKGQVPTSACVSNSYLQKYSCSVRRINQAAKSGDPDAQYALGYMYYYGIGTVRDKETAALWISRAANQGQPLAIKAKNLMSNGQHLNTLHRSTGSSDSGASSSSSTSGSRNNGSSSSGKVQYAPTPSVQTLNTATPEKPIDAVLPNYGSSSKGTGRKSVIKSLRKDSAPVVDASSSPDNPTPAKVEPLTQRDPRLAPNARPNMGGSATTTASRAARAGAAKTDAITASADKMMNVSQQHYTLQLMGGRHLSAIETFVKRNHLQNDTQIYKARMGHENWFMLVYGDYNTATDAKRAIHKLPLAVQDMHPWVKSYRTVHDEIRLGRIVS